MNDHARALNDEGRQLWNQKAEFWDTMQQVGVRSHYVASVFAAAMMVLSGAVL